MSGNLMDAHQESSAAGATHHLVRTAIAIANEMTAEEEDL